MVEKETKIWSGLIGLIGLLIGFGGSTYLSADTIDNTYVCNINEKLGVFDRLTSSHKSGYYIDELGDERRKVCTNGQWIPLNEYAKQKGVDPQTYLEPEVVISEPEIIEKIIQSEDCPVKVIAYTDYGKYYCEGIGPGQECKSTDEILSELG